MNRRLLGLLLFAVGIGFAKWQIYDPLYAVQLGIKQHTSYSSALAMGVVLPPMGLGYLVFGTSFDKVLAYLKMDRDHLTAKNVISILVFAGIFLAIFLFIQSKLEEQGFSQTSRLSRPNHSMHSTVPLRGPASDFES